jgi:hypothetical protein
MCGNVTFPQVGAMRPSPAEDFCCHLHLNISGVL